ncbi:hypothetical protein PQQ87_16035 [Paraburkholderia nemoris]|uniref:hypothetical protein n=1 Tax=Paraburkholderia nemoris TaxID=2793076 RepID=UPI0038B7DD42
MEIQAKNALAFHAPCRGHTGRQASPSQELRFADHLNHSHHAHGERQRPDYFAAGRLRLFAESEPALDTRPVVDNGSPSEQFAQPGNDPVHFDYAAPVLVGDSNPDALQHHFVRILRVLCGVLLGGHNQLLCQVLTYLPTLKSLFFGRSDHKPAVDCARRQLWLYSGERRRRDITGKIVR